jgi:hypothetical protein
MVILANGDSGAPSNGARESRFAENALKEKS